jgi:intracellular sulfur oxidation DsrE/DsrF family protein
MKKALGLVLLVTLVSGLVYVFNGMTPEVQDREVARVADITTQQLPETVPGGIDAAPDGTGAAPERTVLDISVHTVEELQVLFDRAGKLAEKLDSGRQEASIVLVLHGPEVEFFSTRNYDRYKDIVDQAVRLDALDIVDIKICQTMMKVRGVERDDIPPFIEQVPLGSAEIDRLVGEGYVYF